MPMYSVAAMNVVFGGAPLKIGHTVVRFNVIDVVYNRACLFKPRFCHNSVHIGSGFFVARSKCVVPNFG